MIPQVFALDSYVMNPWALPILLSIILVAGMAFLIHWRLKSSPVRLFFSTLCFLAGLWLSSYFLMSISKARDIAIIWSKLAHIFVTFTLTMGYTFAVKTVERIDRRRWQLTIVWSLTFIWGFILLTTNWIIEGVYEYSWGFFPALGNGGVFHMMFQSLIVLLIMWEFWNDLRTTQLNRARQNRNRGFLLAMVMLSLALIDFLPSYGIEVYPIGFVPLIMTTGIVAFTIWNYRLIDYSPEYAAPKVLETMSDALIVCDTDGQIQLANETVAKKIGHRKKKILDSHLEDFLPEITELPTKVRDVELLEEKRTFLLDANGNEIDVILSSSPLTDAQNRLTGIVFIARDIRERLEAEQRIQQLEYYNSVTGLPNRKYFLEEISEIIDDDDQFAGNLYYMEIDGYSQIKGTLGEEIINSFLQKVAGRLKTIWKETTKISHWYEQGFVLLLPQSITPSDDPAEKLLNAFEHPMKLSEREVYFTVSIGSARFPDHGTTIQDVISKAALAVMTAKEKSGNSLEYYEEGTKQEAGEKVSLMNDLKKGLQNEAFSLHYHPILEPDETGLYSIEALVRWEHDEKGFIPPPKMISIAEDTGLIMDLGQWIFQQASNDMEKFIEESDDKFNLSINLSTVQFEESEILLNQVDEIISQNTVSPAQYEVEITETNAVKDIHYSKQFLQTLRDRNLTVAIDDFGTGHSSLKYLMELPVDVLKIDRSFVMNLTDSSDNRALVEAMISMGHELGLEIIAEGVESENQKNFLREENCDYMQGYYWTRPLASDDMLKFIKNLSEN